MRAIELQPPQFKGSESRCVLQVPEGSEASEEIVVLEEEDFEGDKVEEIEVIDAIVDERGCTVLDGSLVAGSGGMLEDVKGAGFVPVSSGGGVRDSETS